MRAFTLFLLSVVALTGCAAEPFVSEAERQETELARRLDTRGPLLKCFESPDHDAPGNERPLETFVDGDLSFAILEVRGDRPCQYRLGFAASRPNSLGATRAAFPLPERNYLAVAGRALGDNKYLFIVNSFAATFEPHADGHFETRDAHDYRIEGITWDLNTGEFGVPVLLATHDRHAVWQSPLQEGEELAVEYAVDHYHEPLFISDRNRGADEGVFRVSLEVTEANIAVTSRERISGFRDAVDPPAFPTPEM